MNRQSPPVRSVVTALAAFLAAGVVLSIPAAAQESPEPPSGAVEGIKVHGHWVIEVRNPDGTLDIRREFDNALLPNGAESLAQLLGRTLSVGFWHMGLSESGGDGPCENNGSPSQCAILEPEDTRSAPFFFKTLTVEVSASDLELSGTATAQRDGSIDRVNSSLYRCTPDLAPDDPATCQQTLGSDHFSAFTGTTLGSPISVVTGQQILVTVTISFS